MINLSCPEWESTIQASFWAEHEEEAGVSTEAPLLFPSSKAPVAGVEPCPKPVDTDTERSRDIWVHLMMMMAAEGEAPVRAEETGL